MWVHMAVFFRIQIRLGIPECIHLVFQTLPWNPAETIVATGTEEAMVASVAISRTVQHLYIYIYVSTLFSSPAISCKVLEVQFNFNVQQGLQASRLCSLQSATT